MCNFFVDIKRAVALKGKLSRHLASKTKMVELEVELDEELVVDLEQCVRDIQDALGLTIDVGDLVSCIISDFVRTYNQSK